MLKCSVEPEHRQLLSSSAARSGPPCREPLTTTTTTIIPALYLGSMMGQVFLGRTRWRCAYGTWAVVVPVVSMPLIGTVMLLQLPRREAKPAAALEVWPWRRRPRGRGGGFASSCGLRLTGLGLVPLAAGLSLVLISLSLAKSLNPGRRREASFLTMEGARRRAKERKQE
ncbi:hypothetical protein MY4038_003177 [Beauveria bassiana]